MIDLYNVLPDTQVTILDVLHGERMVTTVQSIVDANPYEDFLLEFLDAMENNRSFVWGGGAQPLLEMHRLMH